MEGTVTIPIEEYELLTGIKKDFDEKLRSELKRMNEADRSFVLRDRDEYVRRNERLLKEISEKAEELRKVSEANVKLRLDLHDTVRKARENNEELNRTVTRLREDRAEVLIQRDSLLERGLFARIFNRRPW